MTAPTQSSKPAYLEVNIPRVGVVESLMYFAEKPSPKKPGTTMPAQYGFKGKWQDGHEGIIYVDCYKLAADPVALGWAERGPDYEGQPRFNWLAKGEPVQLLMRLQGNKRTVYLSRLNETAIPAAGAASPPPAASPASAAANVGRATPASVPPSQDNGWDDLARQYEQAVRVAAKAWTDVALNSEAKVAAAATVFIEANKRGLAVSEPTATQRAGTVRDAFDKYAGLPKALTRDEPPLPDEVPPWAES